MKKFLMLALVLAISSVAQASFTYSISELSSLSLTDQDLSLTGYTLKTGIELIGSSTPTFSDGAAMTGQYGYQGGNLTIGEYATIGTTVDVTDSVFTLNVYNDNDDTWGYMLYATDGTTTVTSGSDFVWVVGDGTSTVPSPGTTLSLDLSVFDNADELEIGLAIAAAQVTDYFHTSMTVPAPGAILLAGLGTSFVGFLRRRKSL